MNEPNSLIKVTQLPIIEQHLRLIQDQVKERVGQATSLACTPETLAAVKKVRAELNGEFAQYEGQRKAVKEAIMEPYSAFEKIYKECVTTLYAQADADLKGKIEDTESGIKSACEEGLKDYFTELCEAEGVQWLTYERAGIVVDMTAAKQKVPKKLREKITQFVTGTARSVEAISLMDDADEIMAEFKRCLDVVQAVRVVQDRHQRIEQERQAAEARKAVLEMQRAAVKKVEAVAPPKHLAPPVTAPPPSGGDNIFPRFTFTVLNATRSQLIKIREFMKQEGIKYE